MALSTRKRVVRHTHTSDDILFPHRSALRSDGTLLTINTDQISDWAFATSGFLTSEYITSVNSPFSVASGALSLGVLAMSNMPQGGAGDSGKVLTSAGAGNSPIWMTPPSSYITSVQLPLGVSAGNLSLNQSLLSISHSQISDWASATSGFLTSIPAISEIDNALTIKVAGNAGGQLLIQNSASGGATAALGIGDSGLFGNQFWIGSPYGTNSINDFAYGLRVGLYGQTGYLLKGMWGNTEVFKVDTSGNLHIAGALTADAGFSIAEIDNQLTIKDTLNRGTLILRNDSYAPSLLFWNGSGQLGSVYHDNSNTVLAAQSGGIAFAAANGYLDPAASGYSLGANTPFLGIHATNLYGNLYAPANGTIQFADDGGISSYDGNHKIVFARSGVGGNKIQYSEYGQHEFYAGSTLGLQLTITGTSVTVAGAFSCGSQAATTFTGNIGVSGDITPTGDVVMYYNSRGLVLIDRTTGTHYRLKVDGGVLGIEST